MLDVRIELRDTQGRLDHLAIDVEHDRLFVAALAANAIDVADLKARSRVGRLTGRGPQGLAFDPTRHKLWVANGDGDNIERFSADRREATIHGLPDADNLRIDAQNGRLYVGYGQALAIVDLEGAHVLKRIPLPGHPEAFELSHRGPSIYVNVPTAGAIVVVDRDTSKVTARWSVTPAARNFPMALDESHHRLFVATRSPAALQVYDTISGQRVAQLPLCADADDLFLDAERQNLYAVCGEGTVAIVHGRDGDHYDVISRIATSPGARTGLFVAATRTLYVAAPSREGQQAAILTYRVD